MRNNGIPNRGVPNGMPSRGAPNGMPSRGAPNNIRGTAPNQRPQHVPDRRSLYQSAHEASPQERAIDIKEIMKTEIGRVGEQDISYRLHRGDSSIADMNRDDVRDNVDPLSKHQYVPGSIYIPGSHAEVPRPVAFQETPTSSATREMIGVSDVYVEFDSFERLQPSKPEEGLLVFSARSANDENPIDNIIEMQIYPFFIPRAATDPTYQPDFYFYRRITVAIQNIAGVQFVKKSQKTSRWHFELEVENAGSMWRLNPTVDEGKYVFTKPIRDLNIAEIKFRAPEKDAVFQPDCYDAVAVNPADFGPSGDRRVRTTIPHGLTIGSQTTVFFKDFNSTNSNFNAIMNDVNGHVVDVVSSNKLQFTNTPLGNLLGSAIDVAGNPAAGRLCIGERRIRFVIRFRRILPTLTNWIAP